VILLESALALECAGMPLIASGVGYKFSLDEAATRIGEAQRTRRNIVFKQTPYAIEV